MRMPGAASRRYSRITRWAARSRVFQPSHSVGASGPTLRMVSARAPRSRQATDTLLSLEADMIGVGALMSLRHHGRIVVRSPSLLEGRDRNLLVAAGFDTAVG